MIILKIIFSSQLVNMKTLYIILQQGDEGLVK